MLKNINLKCEDAPHLVNLACERHAAAAVGESKEDKLRNFIFEIVKYDDNPEDKADRLMNELTTKGAISISSGGEWHNISFDDGNVVKVTTYDLMAPWEPFTNGTEYEIDLSES